MDKTENNGSVRLTDVDKSFTGVKVVDGISFSVSPGEILGLIGPNGAGKTTIIRMIMDIIKPDSGRIEVLGRGLTEETKNHIGYLPEERGLYTKLTVIQVLTYLATLKGIPPRQARIRADEMLDRVGLLPHRKKKISELSRGMGQMIQFLTSIIHNPSLIIFDEPFANLDPINTELLREIIDERKKQGAAIILSTHRMNEVEEQCDRIFMINKGRSVLYGGIKEIRARYRSNAVRLEYEGELGEIKGAAIRQESDGAAELVLDEGVSPKAILEQLASRGISLNRFEVVTPPLNDIFLQVMGESNE